MAMPLVAPITIEVAAPPKFIFVALALIKLKIVEDVVASPPLMAISPVRANVSVLET